VVSIDCSTTGVIISISKSAFDSAMAYMNKSYDTRTAYCAGDYYWGGSMIEDVNGRFFAFQRSFGMV
jgi:hypothetical protein